MKIKKSFGLLAALFVAVAAGSAWAQGTGTGGGTGSGGGGTGGDGGTGDCTDPNNYSYAYYNHWLHEYTGQGPWYSDMSHWSDTAPAAEWKNQNRVVARGEGLGQGGSDKPADVQGLAKQFQSDREAFMKQQREMEQKMATATDQERLQIREQLREQMEQWKQQQARVREQLQEQCDRLREQLRDQSRLMDRVSNPGTSSGGSGQPGGPRGR